MKRSLQRSWIVFIFVAAFLIGLGFLVVETVMNANDWVDKGVEYNLNWHVTGESALLNAGVISDRNGEVLAQTVDNKRVYNNDADVRKSLLHVVGDNSQNISSSIQSQFRSGLTGYNFIWGLNLPDSFKGGRDVNLTVDAETCKAAYNALKDYDSGACVIYNYKTGEILCDVSTKTYDPEKPPKITKKNESEYEGVYLDNVLSSTYTPGSIFKIVTAAAAIENIPDIWDRTWECSGTKEIGGHDVTCAEYEAHGTQNLEQAFANSCNVVFAELAAELGEEKMNKAAEDLGITSSYNINGIKTEPGSYDISGADEHTLAQSGVGQGVNGYRQTVNPMQMAILCGAIANDGTPIKPFLIDGDSVSSLDGFDIISEGTSGDTLLSSSTAESLKRLMRSAADSYTSFLNVDGLKLCAKTGTGELSDEDKNDGWIVGFSEDSDCPLAFACVVHNIDRQYGSQTAGRVIQEALTQAKKIYK